VQSAIPVDVTTLRGSSIGGAKRIMTVGTLLSIRHQNGGTDAGVNHIRTGVIAAGIRGLMLFVFLGHLSFGFIAVSPGDIR
jgi:hypothetical protein